MFHNCSFFACVSDQMKRECLGYGHVWSTRTCRTISADHAMELWRQNNPYMVDAFDRYTQIGQEDEVTGQIEEFDMWRAYSKMRDTNKWADSPFIEALANRLQCDFIIITKRGLTHIKASLTEEENKVRPFMYIGFDPDSKHYQTYEPLPGN